MNSNSGFELVKTNLKNTYQFYRNKLEQKNKRHYDTLLYGFIDYNNEIILKGADSSVINEIFNAVKLDHPILFYVDAINIKYESHLKIATINPRYRFEMKKTNETIIALLARVKSILTPLINSSDFQKEKAIHDFFCRNDIYDLNFSNSSYECVGPLLFSKGVCEGISKAVKLLCDYANIQCLVVHGTSKQQDNRNAITNHAWNIIKIAGCFYHLDVTFDMTISSDSNLIRYDYYNLSDIDILIDHQFANSGHPVCHDNSQNYYNVNHQTFNGIREVRKYMFTILSKNYKSVVFKLSDNHHKPLSEKEIIKCLNETLLLLKRYNQKYQYSINEHQKVVQIDLI